MKCSVCGRKSNADARFCAQCGTKLNARAETLFRTPASAVPAPGVAAAPDADAAPPATPRPTNSVGLLLLLAAVAVVGYFAYRGLIPGTSTPGNPVISPPDRPAPSSESAKSGTAPTASTSEPAATGSVGAPSGGPTVGEKKPAALAKAPVAAPHRASAKRAATARPAASTASAPVAPAVSVPTPQPVPAAPTMAPPPKPDRFASLNDALARCAGLDLIPRAVCEQRARLQHCEGYWGQVPQCPGGRSNVQTN